MANNETIVASPNAPTAQESGGLAKVKPKTRLLKIPILTLSLIEPLIDIIADYTSDDCDLLIIIGMIIFDFEYAAPVQEDLRVIELFDLCHEIGHIEWMAGQPRCWVLDNWMGPNPRSVTDLDYMDLSNIDWFKSVWSTLKRNRGHRNEPHRLMSWCDVKLDWAQYNDSRFEHCQYCNLFVDHKSNELFGRYPNYGLHRWSKGSTATGPDFSFPEKHTHYECALCREHFIHFFEIMPNMIAAMQHFGVSDRCLSVPP